MQTRLTVLAVALAMARPGHADPVSDFKNGTALMLHKATVSLGETPRVTTAIPIRKAGGTLDFTLNAADFGLPGSVAIRLRGAVTRGGQLLFTVDNRYSPAIDLGGGLALSRITGVLNARAAWLPGDVSTGFGNVRLTFHDSSYFIAHGNWGSRTIKLTSTDVIGGLSQPPIEAFTTSSLVCSDAVPTMLPLTVRLTGAARLGAAPIALESPSHEIRLPRIAGVPTGQRSTIVRAKIPANFVGPVRFVAAGSGVTRTLDVVIRPRRDCEVRR